MTTAKSTTYTYFLTKSGLWVCQLIALNSLWSDEVTSALFYVRSQVDWLHFSSIQMVWKSEVNKGWKSPLEEQWLLFRVILEQSSSPLRDRNRKKRETLSCLSLLFRKKNEETDFQIWLDQYNTENHEATYYKEQPSFNSSFCTFLSFMFLQHLARK